MLCKTTRASLSANHSIETKVCYFCDESDNQGTLHKESTFGFDEHVCACAIILQDSKLIAKPSTGDMVAQEAKYHKKCLVTLHNSSHNRIKNKAR